MPTGSGYEDELLNTSSTARTVNGASRVLPTVPAATTLAISPDGRTVYACDATGTLAAYSTATGAQIRVLHEWPVRSPNFSCQISADPTGRFLIAAVAPDIQQPSVLTGFDLRTGASVTLPVHPSLVLLGSQVAW
jgi:DNA-binding beta-propeller fold protein YncE